MEKENITNIEEGSIQHKLMFHDALIQDVNERIYVDSVKMGIIESRMSALRLEHMAHVINRSRDVFLHEIQELRVTSFKNDMIVYDEKLQDLNNSGKNTSTC